MDKFVNQYLITALWSEELDNYSIDDIDQEAIEQAKKDCDLFLEKVGDLINEFDHKQMAHDFWLTRNGYGACFWDGYYGEQSDFLTKIAKSFPELYVHLGNNIIYIN